MSSTIFFPENGLIRLLILSLVVLFIWGFLQSWRAFQRVGHERRMLQMLNKRQDLLADTRKIGENLGLTEKSLGAQLLRSMLKQQGLAFARPSDALEPVLESVARILAPTRAVPNLLLLLGLIGTVVGLALTLGSLGPQIQGAINSGEPQAVAKSLGVTLREMSGAFAGTFWGVMCAFVLQALNAVTTVRSETLAGELDDLALRFAPEIYPAGTERQIASLQELVRQSEHFLSETQQKISETSDKFATVLTDAGNVIRDSLVTLQSTSKTIGESLLSAAGDVKQSSEKLSEAVDVIQRHRDDFRNIYSSFNEMFERSMTALKLHSDSELQVIRDLQGEFGRVGVDIAQEILKTSGRLGQVSQDIATAQSTYLSGTQDVTNSIKIGFTKLDQQIGDTLKLYTTEVGAVSSRLDLLNKELRQSGEASQGLTKMLKDKDDAERTRQRDQLNSEQRLMASNDRLHESLQQIIPALVNPRQEIINLGSQHAQSTLSVLQSLKMVSEAVEKSSSTKQTTDQALKEALQEVALLINGLLDVGTRSEDIVKLLGQQYAQSTEQQLSILQALQEQLKQRAASQKDEARVIAEALKEQERALGRILDVTQRHSDEITSQGNSVAALRAAVEGHAALTQEQTETLGKQLGHATQLLSTQLQAQQEAQRQHLEVAQTLEERVEQLSSVTQVHQADHRAEGSGQPS